MQWCETCERPALPGKKKCRRCITRDWRLQNPEKHQQRYEQDRLKRFGVTVEWYEDKLYQQRGVCGICGKPETAKHRGKVVRLSIDHNHETQQLRGLLCAKCNRAIGLMQEDPERLEAAARYLRLWAAQLGNRRNSSNEKEDQRDVTTGARAATQAVA